MIGLKQTENWKDIKDYEGIYQISDRGNVKVLVKWDVNKRDYVPDERLLRPTDNGNGYLIIALKRRGKRKNGYVHRLVAQAFLENPDGKNEINHKDYNKYNNNVENLEWCDRIENIHHSIPNMCHPKNSELGQSGERYIYLKHNKKQITYRVCVPRKKEFRFRTLEEAKTIRDCLLKGGDYVNGGIIIG